MKLILSKKLVDDFPSSNFFRSRVIKNNKKFQNIKNIVD